MKTRAVFAILSLFLMDLLAMPPTEAGTTQQTSQTVQTMGVMEAPAYEMTSPTFTMECPWMGYETEQAAEEIIYAECLQHPPISPEASPTDFVRLWYIDTPEDAIGQDCQHYWRC